MRNFTFCHNASILCNNYTFVYMLCTFAHVEQLLCFFKVVWCRFVVFWKGLSNKNKQKTTQTSKTKAESRYVFISDLNSDTRTCQHLPRFLSHIIHSSPLLSSYHRDSGLVVVRPSPVLRGHVFVTRHGLTKDYEHGNNCFP